MIQEEEISLGFTFFDEWEEVEDMKELFLLVKHEIEHSELDLDSFIQGYGEECWGIRGEVMNTEINSGKMTSRLNGYLFLEFELDYNFGCDDYNRRTEKSMKVEVFINQKDNIIKLKGEDIPVRQDEI